MSAHKKVNTILPNSVGLAGEYAVLSQLLLRGFEAGLTLGNTKSIDILAYHPKTGRHYEIEVKTNLKSRKADSSKSRLFGEIISDWQMNKKHEKVSKRSLFYCFVNINREHSDGGHYDFRFFVVPSRLVAKYVKEEHQLWLDESKHHKDSDRRVFRIGMSSGRKVGIATPQAKKYEDNWDFKS